MCFSATASFVSGALLTGAGLATLSRNSIPEQRVFAAMPLIFGLQQISEGFVWYALQRPGHEQTLAVASGLFLHCAFICFQPGKYPLVCQPDPDRQPRGDHLLHQLPHLDLVFFLGSGKRCDLVDFAARDSAVRGSCPCVRSA